MKKVHLLLPIFDGSLLQIAEIVTVERVTKVWYYNYLHAVVEEINLS